MADSKAPFGLDVDRELRAQVLTGRVGTVQLVRFSCPPMAASVTPKHFRLVDPEPVKVHLHVQVRGHTVFAQGNRGGALAPGDLTLVDLSRPFRLVEREDEHEVVKVKVPYAALPLGRAELERLTAVPISGRDGLGAPFSSLTRHVGEDLEGYGPTEGARLATALTDMLVVALAERLDDISLPAPSAVRRELLASVLSFIDQRLTDPDLTPRAIAAANHISLRYLYTLFETQPASVAGWIRERRLERCRRDLLDPTLADWSVSAIGARWGLADPAHFSRVFRAAYGLPPAEYRLTANGSKPRPH